MEKFIEYFKKNPIICSLGVIQIVFALYSICHEYIFQVNFAKFLRIPHDSPLPLLFLTISYLPLIIGGWGVLWKRNWGWWSTVIFVIMKVCYIIDYSIATSVYDQNTVVYQSLTDIVSNSTYQILIFAAAYLYFFFHHKVLKIFNLDKMDKIKLYGFALAGGIGFWFIFYKFSTLALEFFVRTF